MNSETSTLNPSSSSHHASTVVSRASASRTAPSGGINSSTARTASTMRPRFRNSTMNTGLSMDGELGFDDSTPDSSAASSRFGSYFNSADPSRAASPIPGQHLPRIGSTGKLGHSVDVGSRGSRDEARSSGLRAFSASPMRTSGIWEQSWTKLQGIASNVLGSDALRSGTASPVGSPAPSSRRRKDFARARIGYSAPPSKWGPEAPDRSFVGTGTRQDREEAVRVKRREYMLSANQHVLPDTMGNFKRRSSDDRGSASVPPMEQEDRDALVYIHHVQPQDTLAGVLIKYDCQAPVFRRANRFWPNDSIQTRNTVVLPVDACRVKGRPVPSPSESTALLGDLIPMDQELVSTSGSNVAGSRNDTPRQPPPASETTSVASAQTLDRREDSPWIHESWVQIDGHPGPTEIARMSRKTLGFFPPSRRKSVSYSDLDTPSTSLDLPRLGHANATVSNAPPIRKISRTPSISYFPPNLQGPGGVGTLGKDVTTPGPAQDPLNKLFAAHLPNMAPGSPFDPHTATSPLNGIENVGSAIEGWVRKMATRAASFVEPPGTARPELGDLIELSNASSVNTIEEDDNGNHSVEICQATPAVELRSAASASAQEAPPRGRLRQVADRKKED
ncbi:carbohydrate-binding module family 50 protein [Xylona heveae TC161]|uniref:Carbohydrate-binding module family 50 protein n=1 Tax=Xylona heveae (strain CBS 132557 / TC161) TaxID=1328760 RepID=A0A165IWA4_XYLHT|nr:carbohydrate-binding module family 50 protein [Xylona heveae TC161]KZF25468.1 carbohydrate-binding module family 50 protein [Xylona heveae TC161]